MKKIVRLTESKLIELIRGVVSATVNEQTSPNAEGFDYDLLRKKGDEYLNANSELASGKYQSNPKLEAEMINKVRILKADYEKMIKLVPIPRVTTTKFMPPKINPDKEVTKPEPECEPLKESIRRLIKMIK